MNTGWTQGVVDICGLAEGRNCLRNKLRQWTAVLFSIVYDSNFF